MKKFFQSVLLGGALALSAGCGGRPAPCDSPYCYGYTDGGQHQDSGSDRRENPDAACNLGPGPVVDCDSAQLISKKINRGESFVFENFAIKLEDVVASGSTSSAILTVTDKNCNLIKEDKLAKGVTKGYILVIDGKEITFFLTVNDIGPGYPSDSVWADLSVFPVCEKICEPWGTSCGNGYGFIRQQLKEGDSIPISDGTSQVLEILEDVAANTACTAYNEKVTVQFSFPQGNYIVATLGEGESTTFSGQTVKILEIKEDLAPLTCMVSNEKVTFHFTFQDGSALVWTAGEGDSTIYNGVAFKVLQIAQDVWADTTCNVANERVKLKVSYRGVDQAVTLKEGECFYTSDGCVSINVDWINESTQPDGTQCTVSDEVVSISVRTYSI